MSCCLAYMSLTHAMRSTSQKAKSSTMILKSSRTLSSCSQIVRDLSSPTAMGWREMINNIKFDCITHSDRLIDFPTFILFGWGGLLCISFLAACSFGAIGQLDFFPLLDVDIGGARPMCLIGPLVGWVVLVSGGHLPGSHLTHGLQSSGVMWGSGVREDSEWCGWYYSLRRLVWTAQRDSVLLLN